MSTAVENAARRRVLWRSVVGTYDRLISPGHKPLHRQVTTGLAAYATLFVALVVLRISGSSMGLLYSQFFSGSDPRLLAGKEWPIRSDEWLVSTPLTISQVQQGLPRISHVLPGGFDASIIWDLPTRDWSVLMRPHLWGFFFLPLDYAYAFRWWLPLFVAAGAVFVLLCLLWRRTFASWVVAGAFVVSPFFQWWFGAGSYWPPAAAVAACVAIIVLLRAPRAWMRWVAAGIAGYLVAVAAVALYPPYLIPCVYPAIAFCIGWFLTRSSSDLPIRARWRRLIPLAIAAVVAVVVVGAFLVTHLDTVRTVTSTVYPGQRLRSTGRATYFPWTPMYAGVFASALHGNVTGFAGNASEGSSFIFFGFYLVATAGWLVWSRWRRLREMDWAIVGVLASLALLLAYTYVPGWDALAHLLLLDRVEMPRIVIGYGVVSIILLALVVGRLREHPGRIPWWTTVVTVLLVLGNHLAVWARVRTAAPAVLVNALAWPLMIVLLVVAMALFSRGRATVPAALVGVVALVVAGWVNPLYQGVLDLRKTDVGRAIERIDAQEPGGWVSVGGPAAMAVLRETAVEAYSGVQGWPTAAMWQALDPTRSAVDTWDRYAHVNWTADLSAPQFTLVRLDVVQVRLDSCSQFAQTNLKHVLAEAPVNQRCVKVAAQMTEGTTTYYIYDIVPPQ